MISSQYVQIHLESNQFHLFEEIFPELCDQLHLEWCSLNLMCVFDLTASAGHQYQFYNSRLLCKPISSMGLRAAMAMWHSMSSSEGFIYKCFWWMLSPESNSSLIHNGEIGYLQARWIFSSFEFRKLFLHQAEKWVLISSFLKNY